MKEVCIHIMSEGDGIAQWYRSIMGDELCHLPIDRDSVMFLSWQVTVVRLMGMESDGSMLHPSQIATDTTEVF